MALQAISKNQAHQYMLFNTSAYVQHRAGPTWSDLYKEVPARGFRSPPFVDPDGDVSELDALETSPAAPGPTHLIADPAQHVTQQLGS